ncbi:MAG: hypothetical protein LBT89_03920 [Planctomycetaceae bacterium]|jgi:hypothetical protein|nr:hypothetical protein [Planctomycetaceae bacterium]
MDEQLKIDSVEQYVRQTAVRHHLSEGALTQQILLLGDSFYGYRFTAPDFTAVWSAASNTLKLFDADGLVLAVIPLENIALADTIPFAVPDRRAA